MNAFLHPSTIDSALRMSEDAGWRLHRNAAPAMRFAPFPTWDAVLAFCRAGSWLYYQAPMDPRPCAVTVRRVYKNGKIRLSVPGGDCDPFTADAGHLDRMRRMVSP